MQTKIKSQEEKNKDSEVETLDINILFFSSKKLLADLDTYKKTKDPDDKNIGRLIDFCEECLKKQSEKSTVFDPYKNLSNIQNNISLILKPILGEDNKCIKSITSIVAKRYSFLTAKEKIQKSLKKSLPYIQKEHYPKMIIVIFVLRCFIYIVSIQNTPDLFTINGLLDQMNNQINQRFNEMNDQINQRFNEANDQINQRFNEANKHMDERFNKLEEKMSDFISNTSNQINKLNQKTDLIISVRQQVNEYEQNLLKENFQKSN